MKIKVLKVMMAVLLIILLVPTAASASGQEIKSIDITVRLDDDGTAYITQVWDAVITSGTEGYIVQGNLGDIEIKDFSVKDGNGNVFKNIGQWDVNKSLQEKAGKYGILSKGGGEYELCWGIGSYGAHTFIISYTMTNFVKQYSDAAGFNHRLINEELSANVKEAKVTVYKDGVSFSKENSGIWSFGFDGTQNFTDDGKIVAQSNSEFSSGNYLNLLVRFENGIFTPTSVHDSTSFEEVKDRAFEGSDYESYEGENTGGHGNNISTFFGGIIIIPIGFFLFVINRINKNRKGISSGGLNSSSVRLTKKQIANIDYSRDIPFDGSLLASFKAFDMSGRLPSDGAIISAYLLKWIQKKHITIEETEKKGILKTKKQPTIIFNSNEDILSGAEYELYEMLKTAAGKDEILQENEFYKWSNKNYTKVESWFKKAKQEGMSGLKDMDAVEVIEKKVLFIPYSSQEFTQKGITLLHEMFGFKKYLEDFTIINERTAPEVDLWDEYLIYAALFGIADKVAQEFKNLHPAYFDDPGSTMYMGTPGLDFLVTLHMINAISTAGMKGVQAGRTEAQMASSSTGGGGFSSFGGGGGFSGGGSGGGFR
ncbi:MAG: DUF2207 domain-containing protein [Oscillospiraceae bacterium]|jgi:uncharacterized membrane protein|nr:DUF2207 domain-containing protein [Oscillospiraceae bacterium]